MLPVDHLCKELSLLETFVAVIPSSHRATRLANAHAWQEFEVSRGTRIADSEDTPATRTICRLVFNGFLTNS
jgi:hypothetical protein